MKMNAHVLLIVTIYHLYCMYIYSYASTVHLSLLLTEVVDGRLKVFDKVYE